MKWLINKSAFLMHVEAGGLIWGCQKGFAFWRELSSRFRPADFSLCPHLAVDLASSVTSSSVQFSCSVVSDSANTWISARQASLSTQTPGVYSNACPSSRWCHLTISSSVIPFSSCPQSLPASESFPMSQLFAWGGQSTGVSASASVLPMNTQDWSPIGWTGWISLQSKGRSRVFSNTTVQKHQFFSTQLSSQSTLTSIHDHWKNHSLD